MTIVSGDNNKLLLDEFFTLEEVFSLEQFLCQEDVEKIRPLIIADQRFITVNSSLDGIQYWISKRSLLSWLISLNIYLVLNEKHQISYLELCRFINELSCVDNIENMTKNIVQFGQKYGLINPSLAADTFIFPLTNILAIRSKYSKDIKNMLLNDIPEDLNQEWFLNYSSLGAAQELLSDYTPRIRYIIKAREGLLTGSKLTLEKVAQTLNEVSPLSRERIRQIESKFWRSVQHNLYIKKNVERLILDIIRKGGSLLIAGNSPESKARLFITKLADVPVFKIESDDLFLIGISPEWIEEFNSILKKCYYSNPTGIAMQLASTPKINLIKNDLYVIAKEIFKKHKTRLTKSEKVLITLKNIGKPSHYSEVAEVYRSLFPDDIISDHSIHAILGRNDKNIVWIGIRGTYALAEWGYERPSETLFNTITKIVNNTYQKTQKPVPFRVIAAEIGKYRKVVNQASLTIASYCNKELKQVSSGYFIPNEDPNITEPEISANELDKILRDYELEGCKE